MYNSWTREGEGYICNRRRHKKERAMRASELSVWPAAWQAPGVYF